jgi:hypothetical protein
MINTYYILERIKQVLLRREPDIGTSLHLRAASWFVTLSKAASLTDVARMRDDGLTYTWFS